MGCSGWVVLTSIVLLCNPITTTGATSSANFKCQFTDGCRVTAALQPTGDIVAEPGIPITVSCSIERVDTSNGRMQIDGLSAYIYFKFNGQRLNNSRVVNDSTAQVTLPGLTTAEDAAHFFCFLEGYTLNGQPHYARQSTIKVRVKPVAPTILGCQVFNWSRMECYWQPVTDDPHTSYTLCWSLKPADCIYEPLTSDAVGCCRPYTGITQTAQACRQDSGVKYNGINRKEPKDTCFDCPYASEHKCTWYTVRSRPKDPHQDSLRDPNKDLKNALRLNMVYYIRVTASNLLDQQHTEQHTFNTKLLVKPDAVRELQLEPRVDWMLVTWKSPIDDNMYMDHMHLLYRVEYTPVWQHPHCNMLTKIIHVTSNQTLNAVTVELRDLVPYTLYTVTIDCIPLPNYPRDTRPYGNWSDDQTLQARTTTAKPGAAPALTDGGFLLGVADSDQHTTISLFVKSVPDCESHGLLDTVRIMLTPWGEVNSVEKTVTLPHTHLNMYTVTVPAGSSWWVRLEAATASGYNTSLATERIAVLQASSPHQVPPHPERFDGVANTTGVTLLWHSVPSAYRYTLFWCKGYHNTHKCKDNADIQWQTVPNVTVEFYIDLETRTFHDYIFAISTEKLIDMNGTQQEVSSGMTWSNCTFEQSNNIGQVSALRAESKHAGVVLLKWELPPCSRTTYIHQLAIFYCPQSDCRHGHVDRLVVPGHKRSVEIKGLQPGSTYIFRVYSLSAFSNSSATMIPFKVPMYTLTSAELGGVAVSVILVLLLVTIGLVTIIKKCRNLLKDNIIKIEIPDIPSLDENNAADFHGYPTESHRLTTISNGKGPYCDLSGDSSPYDESKDEHPDSQELIPLVTIGGNNNYPERYQPQSTRGTDISQAVARPDHIDCVHLHEDQPNSPSSSDNTVRAGCASSPSISTSAESSGTDGEMAPYTSIHTVDSSQPTSKRAPTLQASTSPINNYSKVRKPDLIPSWPSSGPDATITPTTTNSQHFPLPRITDTLHKQFKQPTSTESQYIIGDSGNDTDCDPLAVSDLAFDVPSLLRQHSGNHQVERSRPHSADYVPHRPTTSAGHSA